MKHSHVFVFGSNLGGYHGKGAAAVAKNLYGAVWGVGRGPTGWAYAIPTKTARLSPRTLLQIKLDCIEFVKFANHNVHIDFKLTRIGCGLAGYTDSDIAPFFNGIGSNVIVDELWKEYFPLNRTFSFTE